MNASPATSKARRGSGPRTAKQLRASRQAQQNALQQRREAAAARRSQR